MLEMETSARALRRCGSASGYRVRPSSGLRAEIGHVLGPGALAA